MLKGISPVLSPDLLKALAEMGHWLLQTAIFLLKV